MANMRYTPDKDPLIKEVLTLLEEIKGEDHLPVDLQIQRMAHVRDSVKEEIRGLKATL